MDAITYLLKRRGEIFINLRISFFRKRTIVFILFCSFSLATCSSSGRQEKPLDKNAVEFLKSVRKYIIVVGSLDSVFSSGSESKNKVSVAIKQASIGDRRPYISAVLDQNSITSKNFKEAMESIGNKKVEQINLQDLGLISAETNDERTRWLKTAGIDAIVEVNYDHLRLDYNTRVPDLSILNLFYTFLLLDIWWIDMVGIWSLEGDVNVKITSISNGNQFSGGSVYQSTSTGNFLLSRIDSKSISESISKITKDAMGKIISGGKSL